MFSLRRAVHGVPRQACTVRTFVTRPVARHASREPSSPAASSAGYSTASASTPESAPKASDQASPSATAAPQQSTGQSPARSSFPSRRPRPAAQSPAATPKKAAPVATQPGAPLEPSTYQPTTVSYGPTQQPSAEETVDVPWTHSFHGISTQPVTKEQFEVLLRPIDEADIEVKTDGVVYLPEIKYRRRLNEAFGPMGWGMIPRSEAVVGQNIVTREYALIVGGRFVSQAQGENNYFSADGLPSAVEGCKSNALMRCCKDLGIASELWDPRFIRQFKKTSMEEVWVEHATTKKKRALWFRKGLVDVPYPYKRS